MLTVRVRHRLGDFLLDVAFEGPADGTTVLFGPSGAGKSATLAIIAGTLRAADARIAIGDHLLTDTSAHVRIPPERRRIGIVHQDARLFPHMPVRANLLYGWARAPGARPIGLDQVVETLAIGHLLDRRTADLSGGERQRVALGRALLSQPELLLLDEPVSALDAARRDEALTYIETLRASFRLPIVYVTHDEDEARRLGDFVVRMDAGRVVASGHPRDVLPRPERDRGLDGVVERHEGADTIVRLGDRTVRLPRLDAPPGAGVHVGWTRE